MNTEQFFERLNKKRVPMHSFIVYKNGEILTEWYKPGSDKDTLHRMFSISKSLTALAIGTLIADNKISIDDKICDYFPEYVDENTHPYIKAMTIKDCLMMRTCHASTTYKIYMSGDWVESFFKVEPSHRPGTVFHYDTSSAHTLAALVEKLTGKDLLSYIKERLPELNFSDECFMKKDPFGISMGGSGLCAKSRDILNFGIYLMNRVNSSDTDALTSFVKDACSNLSPTILKAPLPSEACGYGYMIWRNERGGFVLYGMGGQLVIALPSINVIAVTTADTQGIAGGNQNIYDAFYEEILPQLDPENLCQNIYPVTSAPNPGLIDTINNQTFHLDSPTFTSMKLDFDNGIFTYTLNNTECALNFGTETAPKTGTFPLNNQHYDSVGTWIAPDCFYIRVNINDDYTGSVHFQLFFEPTGGLTVFMKKIEETLCAEYQGHVGTFLFT